MEASARGRPCSRVVLRSRAGATTARAVAEAESEVVDAMASSAEAMRTSEAALCALDESVELSTGAVIMSFGRKTAQPIGFILNAPWQTGLNLAQ